MELSLFGCGYGSGSGRVQLCILHRGVPGECDNKDEHNPNSDFTLLLFQ